MTEQSSPATMRTSMPHPEPTTPSTTPGEPSHGQSFWRLEANGIAVLRLGPEDEPGTITLSRHRLESFERCIEQIAVRSNELRGLVITGPTPLMFAAGADVHEIGSLPDAEAGEREARRGQEIFAKIEALSIPTVVAVGGPCLGGALELSLACDRRVASDVRATKIGLPEVKLGILPGFGGSQRLPRTVGLPKALELILQGKMLDAQRARRAGVIDRAVAPERLLAAAFEEVEALAALRPDRRRRRLRGFAWWASHFAPLRGFVANKVRKTLEKSPAKFYPAPRAALECAVAAFAKTPAEGFAFEARELGKLVASTESKSLVRLFFLTERSKKLAKGDGARRIERATVVGGGVMGAGIAGTMASRGITARLCDIAADNLARAKSRLQKDLDKRVKRRRLTKFEAMQVQDRLAVSARPGSLARTDLWLEAVPEVLDLKRSLIHAAIEAGLPSNAVLATNTSSLPVTDLAKSVPNPERVVGIHFFNPPEKMPLVEIIRGSKTDDATVATACSLAVSLGKFPVVVADRPGFLVNRCLAPYLDEAARLMLEGCEPEQIDRVALDFGFPMGPARLLDEVGLDVAAKVGEILGAAFEHMTPAPLCKAMVDAGHLGSKTGGCFYKTESGKGKGDEPGPGRAVLQRLRSQPTDGSASTRDFTRSEIHDRLLMPMVAEAWRCLEEGVVAEEDDIDLGLVFGIGFPPFLGGLTAWARREGLDELRARMERLATEHGPRFAPPKNLHG